MSAGLEVERWITADVSELKDVRALVESVTAEHGLSPRTRYRVKLALHETVTNAIVHGSTSRSQRVRVRIHIDDEAITFEVANRGRFRPAPPRSAHPPEHGRGLALVFGLMDDVSVDVTRDGTTIRAATHC
jgi:anti-sigma regulatory factor (Ser/Thr protein kinase)